MKTKENCIMDKKKIQEVTSVVVKKEGIYETNSNH